MQRQVAGRRDNAIQELLKGRDFTCQLSLLLSLDSKQSFIARSGGGCAEDLVGKILSTFTHTISLLNTTAATATATKAESSDEVSQLGPRKSESSSGDTDSNPSTRFSRKVAASRSWVKESRTLVDDGYAWRKYGQKKILESDFPRHYYRCTHKFDHNCPATKQIQMLQDRPNPLYRTTYSAHHTCNNHFTTSSHQHFLMDSAVDSTASCHLISFSNNSTTTTTPFLASLSGSSSAATPAPSVVKQQQESLSDVASSGRQTLNQREAAATASGSSIISTAADDDDDENENEKYDMSFIQMMIMDSVDDFQGLLG
ncbi:unnamed protein product [Linum tenue]|uniref:WRKY domain-containing protein n=1 Tax=Linum tenue TaxID=586396 RepID=A0AAV0KNM5_9ROSI|nr:unnamed protein product [Linum tenue]